MATISFTIDDITLPDTITPAIALQLVSDYWDYDSRKIEGETRQNFAKRMVKSYIIGELVQARTKERVDQEILDAASELNAIV